MGQNFTFKRTYAYKVQGFRGFISFKLSVEDESKILIV